MSNYYLLLGVDLDATQAEIRAAYHRLVKELHPDYYGEDSGPFLDLQEAYAVLSDPGRRRAYDQSLRWPAGASQVSAEPLRPSPPPAEPLIPEPSSIDLEALSLTRSFQTFTPSFEEIFDRLWQNFNSIRPKVENLERLTIEIVLTPAEARRGGRVRVNVPAKLPCARCGGHGGIGFFACWRCEGRGIVEGEYPLTVTFPAGIIDHYAVDIPLDRFGIRNLYLTVLFRVSRRA